MKQNIWEFVYLYGVSTEQPTHIYIYIIIIYIIMGDEFVQNKHRLYIIYTGYQQKHILTWFAFGQQTTTETKKQQHTSKQYGNASIVDL